MRIRSGMTLFGLSVLCLAMACATTIRVPSGAATIQAGIAAASNGDTVLVEPGTYYENINFRGKNIVVTSRYADARDTSFIRSTVINGSLRASSDTGSCVLIVSGEDSSAILQGFTITGGGGTNWTDEHGAGLYREGGGILTAFSSPTIQHNLITGNVVVKTAAVVSSGGGGIRAGDGNPRILNNVVSSNTGRYGAGIVLNYTGAIVRNTIITRNSGGQDFGGGALWMNHDGQAGKLIENTTIAGNSVLAVYVWQGSSAIRNCIIAADPTVSAVQIGVRSGGPAVAYSFVQGGWSGEGNISGNPGFLDAMFHLDSGSPCIDAGDTTVASRDREDPSSPGAALWPSNGGLRNDMGAFGGPGASPLPGSPLTSIHRQDTRRPGRTMLDQNYPNPFNPQTAIGYQLSAVSQVSLKVYDALGRLVDELVRSTQGPGHYVMHFNGSRLASGVYFCRLLVRTASGEASVFQRQMQLLR